MAELDYGQTSTEGTTLVRFADRALTYPTLDGDFHERARRVVVERFEMSEAYHKSRFERFYRWEKLYHMITRRKMFDWKANVAMPYGFAVAEQSAAVKWLALMLTRPYVTVRPRRAGIFNREPDMPELEEVARRRQTLLDWHFTGDIDLITVVADMLRLSERYGKAIAMVAPDWRDETLKYRKATEVPTAAGPYRRLEWKMKQSREMKIGVHVLDNTDFFPQPGKRFINGVGWNSMDWCCHQSWTTLDELMGMERAGDVGTAVGGEEVVLIRDTNEPDSSDYKLRRLFLNQSDADRVRDPFDRPVHLIHYQGLVPDDMIDPQAAEMEESDGLNPKKRLLMIGNRQTVLVNRALPWDHGMKGYVAMDCVTDPYDFWGKGKIEPAEHAVYAANEMSNMRLDNTRQLVNALIGIDTRRMPAGWKEKLISQPLGIIPCEGNPNEVIARLQLGDVTGSAYAEQQQLWTLIQEATAVNETMMGAPGPDRTLGEHQLKAESASKRLQFELVVQAQQLLGWQHGLSRLLIGLDRQYLPIPTYIKVVDPDSPDDFTEVQITPEMFEDDDELFTYLPTGSTEGINLAQKRQDLTMLLQTLAPFGEALLAHGLDVGQMIKVIFRTFGFDPQQFFKKVEGIQDTAEAASEQQTDAAEAQAEGAEMGGGEQDRLAAIRQVVAQRGGGGEGPV